MVPDDVREAMMSVLADLGMDLFDTEIAPGVLRVFVERREGLDVEDLSAASRALSALLDPLDLLRGRYTLEVSSPGLERRLRTPRHFAAAHGETVAVRTRPGACEHRRLRGQVTASDEDGFELAGPDVPGGSLRLAYSQVERVTTVFEWGSPPLPGRGRRAERLDSSPGREQASTGRVITT